jgi:serine/threonine protein kinase
MQRYHPRDDLRPGVGAKAAEEPPVALSSYLDPAAASYPTLASARGSGAVVDTGVTEGEPRFQSPRTPLEDESGRLLEGKYLLQRKVGRGGMGSVYEARHVTIGRAVAVKLLDPQFLDEGFLVNRFLREAQAACAAESEHIVSVFDAGQDGARPYLVMELLRGEDLGARLRREGSLPLPLALAIVEQVLAGLEVAHAAGVVHRDLKPENVFLCARPEKEVPFVKLVDFGISKVVEPCSERLGERPRREAVVGTPLYMAPEQVQGLVDVDGRADLYAVGALLFRCLSGRLPYQEGPSQRLLLAVCSEDAPDVRSLAPEVPAAVAQLVARALARDVHHRYQSAQEMRAALVAVRETLVPRAPASRPSTLRPMPHGSVRGRRRLLRFEHRIVATALAALIAGIGLAAIGRVGIDAEAKAAAARSRPRPVAAPVLPAHLSPKKAPPARAVSAPDPVESSEAPAFTPAAVPGDG